MGKNYFILTVRKEKAEELKKELRVYQHNFVKIETSNNVETNFEFYKVNFKNHSEKKALCDFCDYLNNFSASPV